ncbi:restriction endonuclease subunit S [Lonepinella koalarum]|nr:restriction endonuclease subunit S [Lonepinella koalarum]
MSKLLDQIRNCNVEWKPLGEVIELKRGKRLVRKELLENGKYPVV